MLRFELPLVNPDQLLSPARFLAKTVVSNPIKPRGKFRLAPKASDVLVGANECLLREIVGERDVAPHEVPEETAHRRLMSPDQLREGVLVVINKKSGDKICIGQRHAPILGNRRRVVGKRVCVFLPAFQKPDEQVSGADHQRDHPNRPFAATESAVHSGEEEDQSRTD